MSNITEENTAILSGGSVEYAMEEAAVSIDELIAALEDMKSDGMEHVVMASGNYRGAKWATIGTDWSFASEDY